MKAETLSFYEAAIERTVRRVVRSIDEALDLALLAREASLSPFHFHRIFRGMVGETPLEMHRRLRLERAAHQLLSGDGAITRVAFDAGYETHEAFTRAFRHAFAASPSAFRRDAEEPREGCARPPSIELPARSGIHFDPDSNPNAIRFVSGDPMNVVIETLPELRVATVQHIGPYNRISEAFARLGAIAGPGGLLRDRTLMLALYHDDPETTPIDQLTSDAGVTVPNDAALPASLVEKRVPGGRYARTTHVGPYTTLGDAWDRFMGEWLPKSGERVRDTPSYEVYRNTPMTAAPEALRTDLYLPLA